MAMSKTVLGALIKSKMDALSDEDKADRSKTAEAIADAVITHIAAAAVINGLAVGLAAPPGGGPVTGTLVMPPGSIT